MVVLYHRRRHLRPTRPQRPRHRTQRPFGPRKEKTPDRVVSTYCVSLQSSLSLRHQTRARRFAPTAPTSTGTSARITPERAPGSTGIRTCGNRNHHAVPAASGDDAGPNHARQGRRRQEAPPDLAGEKRAGHGRARRRRQSSREALRPILVQTSCAPRSSAGASTAPCASSSSPSRSRSRRAARPPAAMRRCAASSRTGRTRRRGPFPARR
jgi:hypothetical protein